MTGRSVCPPPNIRRRRVSLDGTPTRIMTRPKHCLLIVDDEPNVCDSVHDLLRREFRVLKAHSAEEGYRLMQEEEVHIVMSDQRMPQISGVELLTKVKARYPQAIRMLFTGFADLESVIAAINQGHIFQFLRKPWQPEDLLAGGATGGRRIRPAGDHRPRARTAPRGDQWPEEPALRPRVRGPRPQGDPWRPELPVKWAARWQSSPARPTCWMPLTSVQKDTRWVKPATRTQFGLWRTILNHNQSQNRMMKSVSGNGPCDY